MLKIGLLGLGTVGSGVVKSLASNQAHIEARTGVSVQVARALVRDLEKTRRVAMPRAALTLDPLAVVDDPEIEIIVEVMGGLVPAFALIKRALMAGKHVITANKELLAKHGDELTGLASAKGVRLLFEASVAGGIPIIRMVEGYLTANRIFSLRGILNGTCNYILTQMEEQGTSFAQALKTAQELGYAEANPESDVEGFDAAYKLSILANLAFPVKSSIGDIDRQGIMKIEAADIQVAKEQAASIRLIAEARLSENGVQLAVRPRMIPCTDPLAGVRDVFNAVMLSADVVGDLTFIGRGAGELPTASAVIEDLMEILRSPEPKNVRKVAAVEAGSKGLASASTGAGHSSAQVRPTYYVRVQFSGPVGPSARCGGCTGNGAALEAVLSFAGGRYCRLRAEDRGEETYWIGLVTDLDEAAIEEAIVTFAAESYLIMPYEGESARLGQNLASAGIR